MTTIGERLVKVRNAEGLGVRDFGDRTGVSKQTVLNYEQGGDPPASYLAAVCNEFQINPAWLLFEELPMERRPPSETEQRLERALRALRGEND